MIEATITYLSNFLMQRFNLSKDSIKFCTKENLYRELKKDNLLITLPGIAYYTSGDITLSMKTNYVRSSPIATQDKVYNYPYVKADVSINIAMVANKLSDYFPLIGRYASLKGKRFEVKYQNEHCKADFNSVINELGPLTTPSGLHEAYDFDKGKYYVLEGTFKVNTFVMLDQGTDRTFEITLLKEIIVNWNIDGLQFKDVITK
jgi:hypothetical protein